MNSIYAVCVVVLTVAAVVLVVYLINTLKQVRRSAKALEDFLLHVDDTVAHLNQSARKVSAFVGGFESTWGKSINFVLGLFGALKKQFSKNDDGMNKEQSEASHERKPFEQ